MSGMTWTDALAAPRSIATRGETAVAVIEDPGVVELCLRPSDAETFDLWSVIGTNLPDAAWQTSTVGDLRIVWVGPWRWRVLVPRERIATIVVRLVKAAGPAAVTDLTGAFASFRIVGVAARDILARVCPLDLSPVEPGEARGTTLSGVRCLLLREEGSVASWLALAPRSYAEYVAASLVEAARTPGRLALFEPAPPPPV